MMIKILTVFGTRPEVIKMMPIIKELRRYPDQFLTKICVTGQHRQMIDPLLEKFEIKADYNLNIMQENQSLEHITTAVLNRMKSIIEKESPDYLVIQGDTTTSMAASLAAFYQRVKVAHVEAGLRTWSKFHPYPEEVNRRIIDSLSDLFFAHTEEAKKNLINEGVSEENIEVTGNTVIDALLDISQQGAGLKNSVLEKLPKDGRKIILLTAHRRENFGKPLSNICEAIKFLVGYYNSRICVVYPVHLNPNVQKIVYPLLGNLDNVILTDPLDYFVFAQLMKRADLILTDSGGLQEEAPALGKPVLVLRETTERPEGVKAGTVKIVGTATKNIIDSTMQLLEDAKEYQRMSRAINPYGTGVASKKIIARFRKEMAKIKNMDEANSLISIILPVYNGEKYLKQAIESCLNQTHKNIELIVVDDASTDNTPSIVAAYQDKRIKYIRHEQNRKLPATLNTGLRNASGAYMTWLSDDNYFTEDALASLLNIFREHAGADCIYANYYRLSECGRQELIECGPPEDLLRYNPIGCCFLFKRKIYDKIGGYNEKIFLVEDYEYWLRAYIRHFTFLKFPEVACYYRNRAGNLTNKHKKKIMRLTNSIRSHYIRLYDAMNTKEKSRLFLDIAGSIYYSEHKKECVQNLLLSFYHDPFSFIKQQKAFSMLFKSLVKLIIGERHSGIFCEKAKEIFLQKDI